MRKPRNLSPSGHELKLATNYSSLASCPKGGGIVMPGRSAPPTRDVEASVEAIDWTLFTKKLSVFLALLPNNSYLIVSAKDRWGYVQFAIQSWGVRAEAMSNHYIEPPEYRLSKQDVQALVALGWQVPINSPRELNDGAGGYGGSLNFWHDFPDPLDNLQAASLAVETLRRVYRIVNPTDLNYPQAFSREGLAFDFERSWRSVATTIRQGEDQ
jgi:hypothetical protein